MWRLTVGALAAASEPRHSTILNDSAAWLRGTSCSEEPWPRSAVSYKRLLDRSCLRGWPPSDPTGHHNDREHG